jgi:hypothetical protein
MRVVGISSCPQSMFRVMMGGDMRSRDKDGQQCPKEKNNKGVTKDRHNGKRRIMREKKDG